MSQRYASPESDEPIEATPSGGSPGARSRTASRAAGSGVVQRAVAADAPRATAGPADDPFALHLASGERDGADADAPAAARVDRSHEPTGVFTCYTQIIPGVDHVYIAFEDGYTVGFSRGPGEGMDDIRLQSPEPGRANEIARHPTRRRRDPECRSKTAAEIQAQIRHYVATVDPGPYHLIGNNCGDWVRRALEQAWLVPETPWRIY